MLTVSDDTPVISMEEKKTRVIENTCHLLGKSLAGDNARPEVRLLAGDGSRRMFYRLRFGDRAVIAIVPSGSDAQAMAEARSAWHIGRHLHGMGIPVPEYFAFDGRTGLIVAEDLGDMRLHEYAAGISGADDKLLQIYTRIIHVLVPMQVLGHRGFQASWCWQTSRYDRELMLERESGYFLEALCRDFFNLDAGSSVLQAEFADIAGRAAAAPARFFLHRDFQSRNIMLKDDRIRIIDFQGGRLGPLGYDLASLLLDPYVGLAPALQDRLVGEYVRVLNSHIPYDRDRFLHEYTLLSLQRNMQILGAFAYLSKRQGKDFFRPFIRPALLSLQCLLAKPLLHKYAALKQLADTCLQQAPRYAI